MADTPKRAQVQLGTGATTIYTAPTSAGSYGILRTLQLCNESTSATIYTIGIQTGAATPTDGAGKRIFASVLLAANASTEWTGFLPLNGAATNPDILYGLAGNGASVTVTAGVIEGP